MTAEQLARYRHELLDDGRIRCRVRIEGTYQGTKWTYTDPEDEPGSQFINPDGEPSWCWWAEGNMSCDCNRCTFLPPEWGVGELDCGHSVRIDSIIPLDPSLPPLYLNESTQDV